MGKDAQLLLLLREPAVNYRAQKTSSHLLCLAHATGTEMGVPVQTFRSTEKKKHTFMEKQSKISFNVPVPSHISISENYRNISSCLFLEWALQDTSVCLRILPDVLLCSDLQLFKSCFPEADPFVLTCGSPRCLLLLRFTFYSANTFFEVRNCGCHCSCKVVGQLVPTAI